MAETVSENLKSVPVSLEMGKLIPGNNNGLFFSELSFVYPSRLFSVVKLSYTMTDYVNKYLFQAKLFHFLLSCDLI